MGFLEAIHVHDYESHQNILYKCSSKIILVVIEAGNWIDVVYLDHIIHVGFFLSSETNFHTCMCSFSTACTLNRTRETIFRKKYMENERKITGGAAGCAGGQQQARNISGGSNSLTWSTGEHQHTAGDRQLSLHASQSKLLCRYCRK
jgi:hypothetical protein